jgi:tetratricopeptide (TPR) repeat protein
MCSSDSPSQAANAFKRAIELYRRLEDGLELGMALVALARISVFMSRPEQSECTLAEAFPLLRRAAVPKALARYFETLAFLRMLSGDRVRARSYFEKALSIYRETSAESAMLGILLNLADLTWTLHDLDAALNRFREAVALMRKSPSVPRDMLGHGLTNLAGVHTERGELAEALAAAREGLPLRRHSDINTPLDHLALRAALAGKATDAARLAGYLDAIRAARQASRQPNEARARDRLAVLLREKLPAGELDRLLAEGATLSEGEACRLALEE